MEQKKLTESEFEEFRTLQEKINQLVLLTGQLELQKQLAITDLQTAFEEFKAVLKQQQEFENKVTEKYGSYNIDFETGIIT
jgi:hypothetical protein